MRAPSFASLTSIFGGTFDPPHLGHQTVVKELIKNHGLKKVLIVPCGTPALKEKPRVSDEHRLAMTKLCFDFPQTEVLTLEMEQKEISYAFQTILKLKQLYGSSLCFVIGTDQFAQFPSWNRFPDLLSLCHWMVIERKAEESPKQLLYTYQKAGLLASSSRNDSTFSLRGGTLLWTLKTEAPALSSEEIRKNIAKLGVPPENTLAPPVRDYLMQHSLYGSKGT